MAKDKYLGEDLQKIRKALKLKEQELAMKCNHQRNQNGDLHIDWVDADNGIVKCKTCGDVFSMAIFSQEQIKNAQFIMHSMIQQLRASTNSDEKAHVETYGKVAYALAQVPEKYNNLVDAMGKNKKKKKKKGNGNNNRSLGGYGDALDIVRQNRRK